MGRKKSEKNRSTLHEMKKIFYPEGAPYIDWMGYPITEENKPSYHHIEKRADLKRERKDCSATIENGAYLGKKSHEMLHAIEIYDKDLYDTWNYMFLVINKRRSYPPDDVWDMIFKLRQQSEELFTEEKKVLRKKMKEANKKN